MFAYKNRYDQEIDLNCEAGTDQIEFTLFDRGKPPDPAKICGQPLDDISLSGRGTQYRTSITTKLGVSSVAEFTRLTLEAGIFEDLLPWPRY